MARLLYRYLLAQLQLIRHTPNRYPVNTERVGAASHTLDVCDAGSIRPALASITNPSFIGLVMVYRCGLVTSVANQFPVYVHFGKYHFPALSSLYHLLQAFSLLGQTKPR